MWVYQKTDRRCWTVGFYNPQGTWVSVKDFDNETDAGNYVHYLNGGNAK